MPSLADLLRVLPDAQVLWPASSAQAARDPADVEFFSVSTDTRTLKTGSLFVGLAGPRFDGAAFIAQAQDRGAALAMISRPSETVSAAWSTSTQTIPVVLVDNSLSALQRWATHWRQWWRGELIAVVGSNGKTTVKQMVAAILSEAAGPDAFWATPGNLNNHIGVPLSVLGLSRQHTHAVLELGMNHPGEIPMLSAIAQPTIALLNNAQREHQEFMKSVAAVAEENGHVFESLGPQGTAIIPFDPAHEALWLQQIAGRRVIRFRLLASHETQDHPAYSKQSAWGGEEVVGAWRQSSSGRPMLWIQLPSGAEFSIEPMGLGDHFASNCLAAASCACAANIPAPSIAKALNAFSPVKGRGERCLLDGGGLMVDDTYNANPDSVRAAILALTQLPGPRGLVLGDMGEVGDQEQSFHDEILRFAQSQSLDGIWLHGDAMQRAGERTGVGRHLPTMELLVNDIRSWVRSRQHEHQSPSLWVKGSRFMKMERVITALAATSVTASHAKESTCC
jgi:UDP-N-acetylmuramoyl-tripeptide--D-alanyl-D-alanine ligase